MLIVKILIVVFILLIFIQILFATFGYKEGLVGSDGYQSYDSNDPVICCKQNSANIDILKKQVDDLSTKVDILVKTNDNKYTDPIKNIDMSKYGVTSA